MKLAGLRSPVAICLLTGLLTPLLATPASADITLSMDSWHQLPSGCKNVIDAPQLLHTFFLIQEPVGKRWRTLKYPIRDPGHGQGSSGTNQRFCVHENKLRRRTQTLEELAVCPKGQRLETFSLYVKSFSDTDYTVDLE